MEIEEENSINKLDVIDANSVGYRSLHLVASLGESREDFPEYQGLTRTKFEVQIRTALQHTWAEIEHKQNYRSKDALPPKLQRRLFLTAGTLEGIDREFGEIVREARDYERHLEAGRPDTRPDPLSGVAVRAVLSRFLKNADLKGSMLHQTNDEVDWDHIVGILRNFGLSTVGDLEDLVKSVELIDIKDFAVLLNP